MNNLEVLSELSSVAGAVFGGRTTGEVLGDRAGAAKGNARPIQGMARRF
ncbi:hypothetical protein [Limnothrix sp. PR1529]|nr:hypothetical protein [Limnothrix sp. PR1529]